MKGFRFLGVGGNQSTRRKPTKTGMESANQTHIQPLASCIGERKCWSTKPTCLATAVVCHPDTEQNRPFKIPWPCRGLNRGLNAPQARTLPVCHTTHVGKCKGEIDEYCLRYQKRVVKSSKNHCSFNALYAHAKRKVCRVGKANSFTKFCNHTRSKHSSIALVARVQLWPIKRQYVRHYRDALDIG